ncbi:hypothetical protein RUM43_011358 [Polyplax serrata]|uniref:Transmembrane protein 50A n=1 Tax=Polyplax serrata TaxID=468196 RepID=A0AAN8NLX2_POLSC
MSWACLENLNIPPCVWFQNGENRNAIASIVAGILFFTGWWLIIDVQVTCSDSFKGAYHLCGVFGTLSLFMVNTVSNAVIRGETNGRLGPGGARVWLFIGFVMGFAAIIAACWILFADFVTKSTAKQPVSQWAGSGLFLQNCFIFIASLVYKFGRVEDNFI